MACSRLGCTPTNLAELRQEKPHKFFLLPDACSKFAAEVPLMNKYKLRSKLEFAIAIAREAGDVTKQKFQSEGLIVDTKIDRTPVSEADRAAEMHIRDRVKEVFRGEDGILGEEFGEEPGSSGGRWIIDPIDGTESFVRGVPLYATLLAYELNGEALVGVAYFPALQEMLYAAKGMGAWWIIGQPGDQEPRQAKVSTTAKIEEAMIVYVTSELFANSKYEGNFAQLIKSAGKSRGWSDAYGHALVATGRADVCLDNGLKIWDSAALRPILEEAGGHFTNMFGKASHTEPAVIATNAALLKETVEIMQR